MNLDIGAIATQVEAQGFAIVGDVLSPVETAALKQVVSFEVKGGQRNLLTLPEIKALTHHPNLLQVVQSILGVSAFAFRATFFDKTVHANWLVPWHQDLTIPVQACIEQEGWGPWSAKAGVLYVQPPVSIMNEVLAVRIHLDPCGAEQGALQVIPTTHRAGRLSIHQINQFKQQLNSYPCEVGEGGVVLMRPLLLHSSSKASMPCHRRVIHFEYAAQSLPSHLPQFAIA